MARSTSRSQSPRSRESSATRRGAVNIDERDSGEESTDQTDETIDLGDDLVDLVDDLDGDRADLDDDLADLDDDLADRADLDDDLTDLDDDLTDLDDDADLDDDVAAEPGDDMDVLADLDDAREVAHLDMESGASSQRTPGVDARVVDKMRLLINRMGFDPVTSTRTSIAVVSPLSGDGVSTMSHALARAFVDDFGLRVCRIDLSWARPRRQANRDEKHDAGLVDVLAGTAMQDEILQQRAPGDLWQLDPGYVPRRVQHALIRSPEFATFMGRLRHEFDVVVIDAPPILDNSDAMAVVRHASSHLMVVRQGATTSAQVRRATQEIRDIPAIGSVLNASRSRTPGFIRRVIEG